MNDTNDILITNDDPIDQTNYIRYTNDDVPINEKGTAKENPSAKEFGTDSISSAGEEERSSRRGHFSSDYDAVKIASTFAVVSVIAMAVVLDDSAFSSMFHPFTGIISETFGITMDEDGYEGDCEISLVVTDTDIVYSVGFTVDPGEDTKLKVYNNFTDRKVDLSSEDSYSGTVSGLAKGMKYTVSVVVAGETVRSKTVTTLEHYDEAPTFMMVYARCTCLEDQCFHFMFNVIDRNGVWTDYQAALVYLDGSESWCQFTPVVTEKQSISVNMQKVPVDKVATLVVKCTEKQSDGSTAVKTLYNETVNI